MPVISPLGKWSLAATFLVWYPGYGRHRHSLQQRPYRWYSDAGVSAETTGLRGATVVSGCPPLRSLQQVCPAVADVVDGLGHFPMSITSTGAQYPQPFG